MYLTESGKTNTNEVLIACFDSLTEAHRAQQILAGFGYPRDAVTVVELSHFARKIATTQDASHRAINKVLSFGAILISIIFITLACLFMKSIFSPKEIGAMVLVWMTLTSGGVVICCSIGAVVWRLINSKVIDRGLEAVKGQKILISVKLRTPEDARAIEREWKGIGCEVV